tara:strand:- start:126 stop:1145 length:1020 start_codon:yes stop_codon:yes gene_type:complete
MKKLYFHIGYPRTGTTTLQIHLFPNHPQINYLGRRPNTDPELELIYLISFLNNNDFDKRYSELLEKAKEFYLDSNKINVISSEFVILHAIHYNDTVDNLRTVSRSVSRINSLFSKINVDVYFFCSIRNHVKIIPSFYSAAAPELNYSLTFNGEELVEYLKNNKSSNPRIEILLSGFKYCELYKNLEKVVGKNKIKFFLFEEFNNNFASELSNYLKINPAISLKLLKNSSENTGFNQIKEDAAINSPLSIFFFKLTKNLKNPRILFFGFSKKLFNMFKLLYKLIKYKQKDKEILKLKKENLIKQINIIKNNSSLIKKYYRNDCLELKNELKLDIDKYDYL